MNELIIFKNPELGEIRTLTINGEPWFVGKDVAKALGYSKSENALQRHVDEEDKSLTSFQGGCSTGRQNTTIINESGLYSLILSSKLLNAKKFKHWVTAEVLPQIRKTGGYMGNAEEIIAKTATAVVSEVVKQLIPVIKQTVSPPDILEDLRYAEIVAPKPRRKHYPSTISKLDDEIRKTVDEMLTSDKYSYADVQNYLNRFGIHISQTSIYRYVRSYHF